MSKIFKTALILFVILVGLAFHLRNEQAVVIDYYLGSREMPLSLAIAGALFLGALAGVLSSLPLLIKLKRDNARLGKRLRTQEKTSPQPDIPAEDAQGRE